MSESLSSTSTRPSSRGNLLIALLLLFAMGGLYAYVTRPAKLPAEWGSDFAAAKAQAAREGRPMVVDFGATWCPPCREMARDVLPVQRVADALRGFIRVYVDVDKERELAATFQVQVLPTFIVLDSSGRERYRFEGSRSADGFVAEIAKARQRL